MKRKNFEPFARYQTYRALMKSKKIWNRTLAIISCKIIRDGSHPEELNRMIGLLADRDFRRLVVKRRWHLVFSGGTFDNIPNLVRQYPEYEGRLHGLANSALGVIQVANLVVYGHVFGVAFFNHMDDIYADSPQNLCLRRICNYLRTPLVEDATTIEYLCSLWKAGHKPMKKPRSKYPKRAIDEYYGAGLFEDSVLSGFSSDMRSSNRRKQRVDETLAIVSHDMQKMTMLNFCLENLDKILQYRRVVSTGTTGHFLRQQMEVALESFSFNRESKKRWGWNEKQQTAEEFLKGKIQPLASGPEGGDVQISAKVIDGTCHRILFFQDPESSHPHQFDIRLMEKSVQDPQTSALFASSARTARLIV